MPDLIDLGALGDIIEGAIEGSLRTLFEPITNVIEKHSDALVEIVVSTKHPNAVFTEPTNGPWPEIYTYYWDNVIPLSLFLWAASIGLVIFFESTSHLFSSYHRTKLKKRAFTGLLGILTWWWMAAISLRFVSALADVIVPSLSDVTLFETLSFSAMGVIGLVFALVADLTLFVLIALVYLIREIVLYLFVLLMPILIVLWIPGVGPLSLVSRFSQRLAGFYVPFLFMTVPVAFLLRIGQLLGGSFSVSMGGFGLWLTALVIPIIALLSPFVLFWQAGAVFFIADRASRRMSTRNAQNRVATTRTAGAKTTHGGRNFSLGLQGKPPETRDGQQLLSSDGSPANAAGQRIHSTATHLQQTFSTQSDSGVERTTGRTAEHSGSGSSVGTDAQSSRNENFDTLRDSAESRTETRRTVDDPPREIQ